MIKCPFCGSAEHYHKVSAFLEAETSVRAPSGRFILEDVRGQFGTNPIFTSSFERSLLADKVTPPKPDFAATRTDWSMLAVLLLLLAGALVYGGYYLLASGAFALSVVFFILRSKNKRTYKDNCDEYARQQANWRRQWICKRCGEISVPKDDIFDVPAKASEALGEQKPMIAPAVLPPSTTTNLPSASTETTSKSRA